MGECPACVSWHRNLRGGCPACVSLLYWLSAASQLLRHASTCCRSSCQPPSCECPLRTQVGLLGPAVRWDLAKPTAQHVYDFTRPTQLALDPVRAANTWLNPLVD